MLNALEEQACRNLLARLNRDGGHRQDAVGVVQAAKEAEDRYIEIITRMDFAEHTLTQASIILTNSYVDAIKNNL